jgi:hypothetical protein
MTAKELVNYKPYSIGRIKDNYADIIFQSEGIMTVPKNSAQTIVDLLNTAFKNGATMAFKSAVGNVQNSNGMNTPQLVEVKSKPMPQEEPHPMNSYKVKK